MRWTIRIPFRSEADPITAIDNSELSTLGPGEAEIAGYIVRELSFTDGVRTVADAFAYLERIGDDGRWEGWPPPFERARHEDLEDPAAIIASLGLTAEQYEQAVRETEELLANLDFRRLRDAIARALARVPRLEAEDIAALAAAYGVPAPEQPEEEPAPCNT